MDKVRKKLLNYKWSDEQIQSRVNGLKKFYENKKDKLHYLDILSNNFEGKILKKKYIVKEQLDKGSYGVVY